jgi:NAD(P)H dehydrogenase (quinone)
MTVYGVTAATGQLGRIVIPKLLSAVGASDRVVSLVRNPSKAAEVLPAGAETRAFDYTAGAASLIAALHDIEVLLLISASDFGHRAEQHSAVISAAKAAGVKHIVYPSILNTDTHVITGITEEHRGTEKELRESGIRFTILRNGWYSENFDQRISAAAASGSLYGAAKEGVFSFASRADLADAAVAALTRHSDFAGNVFNLAGDHGATLTEIAAEISRQAGKPVHYVDIPVGDYAAALEKNGLPHNFAVLIAQWDVDAAAGALADHSHDLSKLIGHPTITLHDGVAAALKGTKA